jgi:phenylpyruvate tautomerase PptA (4-oxalocrotonate tautomerase family)
VIIEEVEMDNLGFGGLPVAEFRRLRRAKTD